MFGLLENRKKKVFTLNTLNKLNYKNIPLIDVDFEFKNTLFIRKKSNAIKGCFDGEENKIYLNKTLSFSELEKVLLHEYGHAIDLFIGLHHNKISSNYYFYSDQDEFSPTTLYSLKMFLKKHYEDEHTISYYMKKDEIFPELFSHYVLNREDMPKPLIEIVEKYLNLFNFYVDSYNGKFNYFNSIDLRYRNNRKPNLKEMLEIKNLVMKNPVKYESIESRIVKAQ